MPTVRRWVLFGVCALALSGAGCNLLSLPFFIFGPEPKIPPQMQRLASDDEEKEVHVAVLTANGLETRPDLMRADRELTGLLIKHLKSWCKYNQEKVKVRSLTEVENYKSDNPDWDRPLDLEKIGKDLNVDYVIYLEINSLSLYDRHSVQFYRGRAEIRVTLFNVHKPEEQEQRIYTKQFPSDAGNVIEVSERSAAEFRHQFLNLIAEELSWWFTAHPTNKEYVNK